METRLDRFFHAYLGFANRRRLLCGAAIVLLFAASFWLASGLKLRSSLKELLPDKSQSVVELDRMLAKVGGTSVLTVTVDSPDPAANMRFIDDLNARLSELPKEDVRYVIAKVDRIKKFYEENILHFIDVEDLKKLYSRVKRLVDYEKFKRTPFFLDLEAEDAAPPISLNFEDIKERNEDNVKMPLAVYGDYYGGEEGRFLILMVRPQGTSIEVDRARELIDKVKAITASMNPGSYSPQMRVGFCGNLVTTVEEYDTLKTDMFSTAALCIFLVCLALGLYFLRLRVIAFLGATLVIGITFTFAITRVAIGYLNAQTAFLASIIIGTGINYGIIVMGRYLEERKAGASPRPAMEFALARTAVPTFLAAATTAVAFIVLMIARVKGLSQFGFIGSVGVMATWLTTIFLLPLMVVISERVLTMFKGLMPPKRQSALLPEVDKALSHFPLAIILVFSLVAAVAGVITYRFLPNSLEYDFSKLRNRSSATTGTEALERRVSKLWVGSMTPAVVLLDKAEEGPAVCDAVMRQNEMREPADRMVDSCVNVFDLLPSDQEGKAAVLASYQNLLSEKWVGEVKGKLGDRLRTMKKSLNKMILTVDDLPRDLVRNFEDLDGNVGTFAFINPRSGMPLTDGRNLMRFADTIQDIKLPDGRTFHATGESLIFSDLVKIVKQEAPILMAASFIAVSIFVILLIRRLSESYVIILSLVWVGLVMIACMAIFDIKINFFNFIAIPLTFGIGVDYSINIAMRFHEKRRTRTFDIIRHTGGAVALCSITTIIGYLVLTKSTNQAVAQFGYVAVMGEIAAIMAAMFIVPSVIIFAIYMRREKSELKGAEEKEGICES